MCILNTTTTQYYNVFYGVYFALDLKTALLSVMLVYGDVVLETSLVC